MTNKEAVIAALQIIGYSDIAVEKALLDAGIDGNGTYTPDTGAQIDSVAVEVLQGMLSLASVSEGGYSVSYSVAGIEARIDYLNGRNGISAQPTVTARNVW